MPVKKITPDEDILHYTEFVFREQKYQVKTSYKIGRFLRTLNESPIDALEIILEQESFDRFLDIEMDMEGLKEFLEILALHAGGSSTKN